MRRRADRSFQTTSREAFANAKKKAAGKTSGFDSKENVVRLAVQACACASIRVLRAFGHGDAAALFEQIADENREKRHGGNACENKAD
jgi:hypothetical protein